MSNFQEEMWITKGQYIYVKNFQYPQLLGKQKKKEMYIDILCHSPPKDSHHENKQTIKMLVSIHEKEHPFIFDKM